MENEVTNESARAIMNKFRDNGNVVCCLRRPNAGSEQAYLNWLGPKQAYLNWTGLEQAYLNWTGPGRYVWMA